MQMQETITPAPKQTVKVCFKKDRKTGEIIAILPEKRGGSLMVSCYTHEGQHSMCSKGYITTALRAAGEKDYAPLLKEIRSIYKEYKIKILKKLPALSRL